MEKQGCWISEEGRAEFRKMARAQVEREREREAAHGVDIFINPFDTDTPVIGIGTYKDIGTLYKMKQSDPDMICLVRIGHGFKEV